MADSIDDEVLRATGTLCAVRPMVSTRMISGRDPEHLDALAELALLGPGATSSTLAAGKPRQLSWHFLLGESVTQKLEYLDMVKIATTNSGAIAANAFTKFGQTASSKPLKFSKGDWTAGIGSEQQDIAPGTEAVAILPSLKIGWQNFGTRQHCFVPLAKCESLPTRNTLGDTNPLLWELDEAGEPRDPWQKMHNLPFVIGDELYTFSTSSKGGTGATRKLASSYGKALENGQRGKLPIVRLSGGQI
jgi:hypothetical protein